MSSQRKALSNEGSDNEVNWNKLYDSSEFSELVKAKRRFIIPALTFFTIYYTLLLVIQGYFPDVASKPIFGALNVGYLYALSQIPVAWVLCFAFIKYSKKRIDPLKEKVSEKVKF